MSCIKLGLNADRKESHVTLKPAFKYNCHDCHMDSKTIITLITLYKKYR